jgi:ankyrin repeat protein
MEFPSDSPFYRLLATKYDSEREQEALEILAQHPELARLEWPGPDEKGQPFVKGSTALHYAANDGKLRLVNRLIDLGADVNASQACWFRSVLSWAANNARVEMIRLLLQRGADVHSFDALHAAAWGGSGRGQEMEREYAETLKALIDAGADKNDRRHCRQLTPLAVALESGNQGAIEYLRSVGAAES